MQLSSLSRIYDACRVISAAECNPTAEAFKALCGSVLDYTGIGVKQATFKESLVSLPAPGAKMTDGSALLNRGGLGSLKGLAAGYCFGRQASSGSDRA